MVVKKKIIKKKEAKKKVIKEYDYKGINKEIARREKEGELEYSDYLLTLIKAKCNNEEE